MDKARGRAYVILSSVLALLCGAIAFRLQGDLGQVRMTSPGILFAALLPAIKCGIDLFDKRVDAERRLLSVAALVPVSLFLLSFYVPPSAALGLLALAAAVMLAGTVAAFLAGRKLPRTPAS